ncbi:MAG: cation:proton antiporter [Thermomicrobiales bacterium]
MGVAERLFLQLAVILIAGRAVGFILRPARQPQVVAEMVVGLLLGPSLLGLLAPGLQHAVFPTTLSVQTGNVTAIVQHPSTTILFAIGQLGLILYMFLVGAQLDIGMLGSHRSEAGRLSLIGIVVPALAGGLLGVALAEDDRLFPSSTSPEQGGLFLASAMAVTAFPVLARILTDTGAAQTRIGTLAISAAAFDDAVAWTLLALTLALAKDSASGALVTCIGAVAYAAGMIFFIRPLLRRLDERAVMPDTPVAVTSVLTVVFLCAAFTEEIGVHAVFGAFVAGAVLPRGLLVVRLRRFLEPLTVTILLPVFFVYAGLNTRIGLLREGSLAWIGLAIILLAFVCKGGGCAFAMRLGGASYREAGAVGALMNARGLMELTLITIGLERGLISPALYTILALMALATTVAAPPIFQWLHPPESAVPTFGAIDALVAPSGSER